MPKGGVISPIWVLISIITAYHSGSKPRAFTRGINMGKVIMMILDGRVGIDNKGGGGVKLVNQTQAVPNSFVTL